MTPDMSFVLNHESGFDEDKEELLMLMFTNSLLSGYKADCSIFKDLDSKLPLKLVLRREVDLAKTFDSAEVNGVACSHQPALLEEAEFYLGDKSLLSTAIYSLNNSEGLARLSKSFSLLNHIDYPKDFAFMAGFFEPKLKDFAREKFLQQIFMLLDSTTDEACQLELVKILYYVYNSLKFQSPDFHFRNTLRAEQAEHLLLGDDALRRVLMLAVQSVGKQFEAALLILVNIVKYTEQEFLAIADRDFLAILFSKVASEASLNAYAALALLLYCLSLKQKDVQSKETIVVAADPGQPGPDGSSPGRDAELGTGAVRPQNLLAAALQGRTQRRLLRLPRENQEDGRVSSPLPSGEERLLHVECLKLLRSAAAAGKFGAVGAPDQIALEVQEILAFIKAKLLEGNTSEGRIASQIVWNLSFSNHNLVDPAHQLVFDLKLHENVLKGLETPSRANFDQLVCLKSFLQNKVTIGLLADTNIVPVLFSLLLTYKAPDKNCGRCLASAGSYSDLPLLCLILENTRLILDYGFRSADNANLFSPYFTNFSRAKFQEFVESLCQDRKLILRNLNNAFVTSICEKNVRPPQQLLHNISGLCSTLIRIFTHLKHFESIKDIESTESGLRSPRKTHRLLRRTLRLGPGPLERAAPVGTPDRQVHADLHRPARAARQPLLLAERHAELQRALQRSRGALPPPGQHPPVVPAAEQRAGHAGLRGSLRDDPERDCEEAAQQARARGHAVRQEDRQRVQQLGLGLQELRLARQRPAREHSSR